MLVYGRMTFFFLRLFVYACMYNLYSLFDKAKKLLINRSRPIPLEKIYTSGCVLSFDRFPFYFFDMNEANHQRKTNLNYK